MLRILSRGLVPLLLLATAAPALAQKEFGFDNRKPSGQPYLKPEESLAKMTVAPEFEVKLFAGEPDVINPVAFSIDEKGRIWVLECFEYPSKTPKGKAPRDRIVILEDTDGDGKCDKRTVFAEGKDFPIPEERRKAGLPAFDLATGLEVGHGGVYVGAPPYLWFIENKNDKPGKFETLVGGFGSQDTHETLNTFQWGPDGWLYGMQGVFTQSTVKPLDGPETRMNGAVWRFHPKTKKFEIFAEGTSNPWGLDWRNTDGQFILACCVIPHLYHIVPGGIYKRQAGTSYNPYSYGYINEISDHTFHKESGWAHAGLISLDAPHVPEKYRNSVIFGSIHGCSVKQNILKPNGSSYTASRGDDFLVSADKNFRPINMKWGPLGDIYLIDWHDQNPCHQAAATSWDYERGRVYRIQLKGTKAKKAVDIGSLKSGELSRLIKEGNPYEFRTVLRLAYERYSLRREMGKKFADKFNNLEEVKIDGVTLPAVPFGGVWVSTTFRQLWLENAMRDDLKVRLNQMASENTRLSINTYRLSSELIWNGAIRLWSENGSISEDGLQLLAWEVSSPYDGRGPAYRREVALAAIRHADNHDILPVLHALMKHKEDAADPLIPHLVWLAYEKVLASGGRKPADGAKEASGDLRPPLAAELAWLAEQAPDNLFVRDQIVPKVMRRLVATGQPGDLSLCLKFVADAKDVNTREKALDGLVIALDKQTVNAPANWASLQAELTKEPRLVALVNRLAVNFRDPAAIDRATKVLNDSAQPVEARAEAVRQLAQLKAPRIETLFVALIRQNPTLQVKIEAARGLAVVDDPKVPGELFKMWATIPPPVRAELVGTLAGRKAWAKELLQAMEAKTVDRRELSDNTIIKIQAFNDKDLNAQIEKSWGRTRPTPVELNKLIDKMRGELAQPGSFARGKIVFANQCAKCHKFEGTGAEVGPPLDGAGRDIEYILANVIDPNRVIGAPYFQRIVKTLDGRVEQGLLAEEDDKFITLKVENGVLKKIAKKDLDEPVKIIEKSMMPEGITTGMSTQDFRDLVRFVMASPFITDVNVDGRAVAAGVNGYIALPDRKVAGTTVVEAKLSTNAAAKTQLLVGSRDGFEVFLDGKPLGTGKGSGARVEPDREAVAVELTPGEHTITVKSNYAGIGRGIFLRLLDPDRKVSYPEVGKK